MRYCTLLKMYGCRMKNSLKEEKELLESVERGECKSVPNLEAEKKAVLMARETLRKNKRVNIRISKNDLDCLQRRTYEEEFPVRH